jgi:GxxExxY protein
MRTAEEINGFASQALDGAVEIHRKYGPGMYESAYMPCFAYELQLRGLAFVTKVPVPLFYKGLEIPRAFEADFIVEGCLLIELKAVETLPKSIKRQMRTYLTLLGCPLGLIVNFGEETLMQGVHRVVNNFPVGTPPYASSPLIVAGSPTDSEKSAE